MAIKVEEFLDYIRRGEIPPEPPEGTRLGGFEFPGNHYELFTARDECTKRGMWAIVDRIWTKALADWIGEGEVLEVMAGAGWLAKALSDYGIDILATDNESWNEKHSKMERMYPVMKLEAVQAVKENTDYEVLIISWPPYEDRTIVEVCNKWGKYRPIVYIGEGEGGCNAPDEFFENFKEIENMPNIPLHQWLGLHDQVLIGYWTRNSSNGNQ